MGRAEFKDGNIRVDGKRRLLIGGAFHYYRIPKPLWAPGIEKLKAASITFIDLYIPWGWHEAEEGRFDFTGRTRPERDLVGVCRLIEDAGLAITLRPGPYINAEYLNFGYPPWLFEKYPEVLQVAQDGRRWHTVSFNHPKHLELAGKWFKALFEAVRPFKNILCTQIDNETGVVYIDGFVSPTPFFRDYNPATMEMFRTFLKERYGSVEALNRDRGTSYARLEEVRPVPRLPWRRLRAPLENLGEVGLWQEFLEEYLIRYLNNLKGKLREAGAPEPFFLNEPALLFTPGHTRRKAQEVGPVGYDLYPKVVPGKHLFDMPFVPCFGPKLFANYRGDAPVFSPETQCGWFDPFVEVPMEETVQLTLAMLAHGTRWIGYYILHDCVEADGALYAWNACIGPGGETLPRHGVVKSICEFARKNEELLLESEEVTDPFALLEYFPNHRMYSSDPFDLSMGAGAHGLLGLFHEGGPNPEIADLEMAAPEALAERRLLILPSNGFMDAGTLEKLKGYVSGGGHLMVTPKTPSRDLQGRPLPGARDLIPSAPGPTRIHYQSQAVMHILNTVMIWRALYRWRVPSKWQNFTLDGMRQGIPPMNYFFSRRVALRGPDGPFPGAPLESSWDPPAGAETLLTRGKRTVGWTAPLQKGRVTVVGTLPGALFSGKGYYSIRPGEHRALKGLAGGILDRAGVAPALAAPPGVEAVARRARGSTLLFLLNRGPARTATVEFRDPGRLGLGPRNRVETLYAHGKSKAPAGAAERSLEVPLDANDGRVLLLTPSG
ncbi:MAG: beta-galactosidase [Halobacteria archaeon]